MISNDTLFILGAGASAPYGYPKSSGDLKDDICLNFKADMDKLFKLGNFDRLRSVQQLLSARKSNGGWNIRSIVMPGREG